MKAGQRNIREKYLTFLGCANKVSVIALNAFCTSVAPYVLGEISHCLK